MLNILKRRSLVTTFNNKLGFIIVILSLLNIYLDIKYNQVTYLLILTISLRLGTLIRKPKDSLTFYVMWFYFELSFIGHIFLSNFIQSYIFSSYSLMTGEIVITTFLASFLLIDAAVKKRSFSLATFKPMALNFKVTLTCLVIFSSLLTLTAYCLAVVKMGVLHPDLPYKLEPMLTLARQTVVPFFFIVFIGRELMKTPGKINKRFIILLFCFNLWLLTETILKGSRGFILINNFPVILLLIVNKKDFLKKWIIILTILTPVVFIAGQAMRTNNLVREKGDTVASVPQPRSFQEMMWDIYERNFYDARIIDKFQKKLGEMSLSEHYNTFIEHKGGMHFHTYAVDQTRIEVKHSSGTTFTADSYLLLGQLGVILSVILLALITIANDKVIKPLFTHDNGIYCFSIYWLFERVYWGEGFWSYFIFRNPLTYMLYPVLLITFVLANNFLRKRFSVKT